MKVNKDVNKSLRGGAQLLSGKSYVRIPEAMLLGFGRVLTMDPGIGNGSRWIRQTVQAT